MTDTNIVDRRPDELKVAAWQRSEKPLIRPILSSRRAILRPADANDGAILYQLLLEHGLTTLPSFTEWITHGLAFQGAAAQFVVRRRSDEKLVGYTSLHKLNLAAGHVETGVYATDEIDEVGIGAEAIWLTINYAFAMWPVRKVYFHTTEASRRKHWGGKVAGISREEAVLPDHQYFLGRHWDVYICAIYRDDWLAVGLPLVTRLSLPAGSPLPGTDSGTLA